MKAVLALTELRFYRGIVLSTGCQLKPFKPFKPFF